MPSPLGTDPPEIDLSIRETNITFGVSAAKRLAKEGDGVTMASAVATLTDTHSAADAPTGALVGSVGVESPVANVTFNPSLLPLLSTWLLIVLYTSSAGNTQAIETLVNVKQ